MKRRLFLKLSLFAALTARTSRSAVAHVLGESAALPDRFFYDERFTDARAISSRLLPRATLTPVQSDVTALWTGGLKELSRQRPLSLRGVTTESFHFCLKTLLRSEARVETQTQRVGKDLYAWSIRTTIPRTTGVT
ncbi:MAG TPA: hypothetical protein VKA19_05760 [Alphaproteobacteria bacterium]|nr:hypothetical protein [Alphaproteobacteria bacterium]